MQIKVTVSAARQYQKQINNEKGVGIRLSLRPNGCSGWKHQTHIQLPHTSLPSDVVSESSGISFYVPEKDAKMLDGLIIDFVRESLNRKFIYQNPLEESRCGCGESVELKVRK